MKRSSCVVPLLILAFSGGSTNATAQELQDVANMPRPIEALDNVWIEELTMMEVRDALAEGKTTALILTGGIEENGPYLTTGKHNHVLRVMGESIARRLGDALIAPIVALEPGNPANSRSPGTVVLSRGTYEAMLTDMATSLRSQGFQNIILIGDSGGNQRSMATVADALSTAWRGDSGGIYHIPEYYNYDDVVDYQRDVLGVDEDPRLEGLHDDYYITSIIMNDNPQHVRLEQRIEAGKASINGISIVPIEQTIEHGRRLIEFRTDVTVGAIGQAMAAGR